MRSIKYLPEDDRSQCLTKTFIPLTCFTSLNVGKEQGDFFSPNMMQVIKPKFMLKLPLQLPKFYALVVFAFTNTYNDKDIFQKLFSTPSLLNWRH